MCKSCTLCSVLCALRASVRDSSQFVLIPTTCPLKSENSGAAGPAHCPLPTQPKAAKRPDALTSTTHDAECIMRTTLTLEDEVVERLKQASQIEGKSFKEVVNAALRRGLGIDQEDTATAPPFRITPHSSPFQPNLDLARLNQLNDELETDAFGTAS